MKKIVVLSGAGMSAESGLKTFRDNNGLWEEYNVMDVATPEAWQKNPKMVLEFYNKRRKEMIKAQPNLGHQRLAQLEELYEVQIITQNVDNLHERAGSTNVLHLHGELTKARSSVNEYDIHDIEGDEIKWGDKCARNSQLRPHIVWFGEAVPKIVEAELLTSKADILIIIGTSMAVYPAAGLVHFSSANAQKYLIDPGEVEIEANTIPNLTIIKEKASTGMTVLAKLLGLPIR